MIQTLPRYLMVIPSSVQMYSGTGRVIMDWALYSKRHFDIEFLMDVRQSDNFRILENFCHKNSFKLNVSLPYSVPGCVDNGIMKVAQILHSNHFDYVEIVSWANAAANIGVMFNIEPETKIVFTPHTQPIETLCDYQRYFGVEPIFKKLVQRVDYVFADSPFEKHALDSISCKKNIYYVPLGVNEKFFEYSDKQIRRVCLTVCDFKEQRKRVDNLINSYLQILKKDKDICFIFVGKNAKSLSLPNELASHSETHENVSVQFLANLYQTSSVFVLLSDYEAFGIPIAEALCCGCPVVINRTDVLESIYSNYYGAYFVNGANYEETSNQILSVINNQDKKIREEISNKARADFSNTFVFNKKLCFLKR